MPNLEQTPVSRRGFLRGFSAVGAAALLSACGTPQAPAPTAKPAAAPPTAPPAAPATSAPAAKAAEPKAPEAKPAATGPGADWDELVAAAKKEGTLAAVTGAGSAYRRIMDLFQEAFPGVTVEHTALRGSDFAARVRQERQANLYNYDIAQVPTTTALTVLRPAGVWEPVKPVITRPDVLDDKVWEGGFDAGWPDTDKKWAYAFCNDKARSIWIHPGQAGASEIKSFKDIVDPKFKGKIALADPRTEGRGYWPMTTLRANLGGAVADDLIRKLLTDMDPFIGTDARQMTEAMARGRYAVGIGAVDEQIIVDFQDQGVGKELQAIDNNEEWTYVSGTNIWLVDHAPHPNAAKLFINWLLTKDGQTVWSRELQTNSRRVDVPAGAEERQPQPGKKYVQIDAESLIPEIDKTRELITEIMK
ncbi:MAG TPA: extracellular solute-binding protein [Chloroflexota bacterium]|jgi:iron(III) transport system substrate-binding protein|nr:extracellular solute-binding protein [Chloroflexota bacterium]